MNEDQVLYGAAIGFMPIAERLRFYEYRAEILKDWDTAGYGDPQAVKFAIKRTDERITLIKDLIKTSQNSCHEKTDHRQVD